LFSPQLLYSNPQFGHLLPDRAELKSLDHRAHHRQGDPLGVILEWVPVEDFLIDGTFPVNAVVGGAGAPATSGVGLIDTGEVGLPQQPFLG
jgi:hypothetical protein